MRDTSTIKVKRKPADFLTGSGGHRVVPAVAAGLLAGMVSAIIGMPTILLGFISFGACLAALSYLAIDVRVTTGEVRVKKGIGGSVQRIPLNHVTNISVSKPDFIGSSDVTLETVEGMVRFNRVQRGADLAEVIRKRRDFVPGRK